MTNQDEDHELTEAPEVARFSNDSASIPEAYALPQHGEWPFAFYGIDAVYVWTQGGYQIGRNPDDYPLFIAIREQDRIEWEAFFESVGVPMASERLSQSEISGPIQFVVETRSSLEIEYVEGYPVIPRAETITFMQENYAAFESALALLNRMHDDLHLNVAYRESERT